MNSRRIYIISWRSDPNGIELDHKPVAGAIVNVPGAPTRPLGRSRDRL